jgi:hypothetical protein
MRTGGVESPNHRYNRAAAFTASAGAHQLLSVRMKERGGRPGSNRRLRGSHPRVLPSTPRPPRSGTTGLEPAAARLTSECSSRLSYAPETRWWKGGTNRTQRLLIGARVQPGPCPVALRRGGRRRLDSAGGIRTHGLELMRLARTAPPLPRKVWLAGVEPALSGAQSRWGGQLPYSQTSNRKHPRRDSNPQPRG